MLKNSDFRQKFEDLKSNLISDKILHLLVPIYNEFNSNSKWALDTPSALPARQHLQ